MSRNVSRISYGADNGQAGARATFDRLTERIRQVTFLKVSARRNINDANLKFRGVIEHPLQTFLDLCLADSTRAADFHQHQLRVRRDPAIEAAGEFAVTGGHD